ncbi:MAG: metallophosphoesterase family protein [Oscillospiraceae bacterium]|nr:metallophosphoesterase family protein [Oscillospiraceae bacterium]
MRILAVSDMESKFIWDHFDPSAFQGIDFIISCGDLKASYLSFIVSMIPAPLFYVHGNHDTEYLTRPPEGCIDIDGRVVSYRGLRIGGLGGCLGSSPEPFQFTEQEMSRRARRFEGEIKRKRGLDIFVSHAAPLGFGDGDDPFHKGFEAFCQIDAVHEPTLHFFGHKHLSGSPVNKKAVARLGNTTLVNATGYRVVDIDELQEISNRSV